MTADKVENLTTALAQAAWHIDRDPPRAINFAREILVAAPNDPRARLYLAAALRRVNGLTEAQRLLEALCSEHPDMPLAWFELGLLRAARGATSLAIEALAAATRLRPDLDEAWSALSAQYALAGNSDAAAAASARRLMATLSDPVLVEAARAISENQLGTAEQLLLSFLKARPSDGNALRMLADIRMRTGRYGEAEELLAQCLEAMPDSESARYNYALALHRQNKYAAALAEIENLIGKNPQNPALLALKAAALGQVGENGKALDCYEAILKDYPTQLQAWINYGNTLQSVGRQQDAIAAFRKALAISPSMGAAYWSLANLKTFKFSPGEKMAILSLIADPHTSDENRLYLHFALAKLLEDEKNYEQAFAHYSAGNSLRRKTLDYDAKLFSNYVQRCKSVFTSQFFASREPTGNPASDPIFIIGLPRSGSTLLEQILASHSQVEGTMELPYISRIAWKLAGNVPFSAASIYPDVLARLGTKECQALGEEYIERASVHRRLRRAHFIDKDPNNFAHIGLIARILPNAKIIDARRHPLSCCFSAFKQHFVRGQEFSYDLADVGRYYADYVELMSHFDAVLPGKIHRVFYEDMVADTEREIRRLLDYCRLPFEAACLEFHKTERAVVSASSEQVRRPIFRDGVEQWKNFLPWLGPLKEALGNTLHDYGQST